MKQWQSGKRDILFISHFSVIPTKHTISTSGHQFESVQRVLKLKPVKWSVALVGLQLNIVALISVYLSDLLLSQWRAVYWSLGALLRDFMLCPLLLFFSVFVAHSNWAERTVRPLASKHAGHCFRLPANHHYLPQKNISSCLTTSSVTSRYWHCGLYGAVCQHTTFYELFFISDLLLLSHRLPYSYCCTVPRGLLSVMSTTANHQ